MRDSGCVLNLLVFVFLQVKFTAYKERPAEERKRKFVEDLHEGHSVIVSSGLCGWVVTGLY